MNARLERIEIAARTGRRDEAIADLIALVTAEPDEPAETYLLLARQLYATGRFDDGEAWAARGLERHPDSAELWNVRGVCLRRLGRGQAALEALTRASGLKPSLAPARINRANVLIDLGEMDQAVDAFSALLATAPGDPAYLHYLASALAGAGRADAAMARFRETVALKPDDIEAWRQLTILLADAHRTDEALTAIDAGLAANPDTLELLETKALLLRTIDDPARAEAHLEAVTRRFPNVAWAYFHLGDLLWESDRPRGLAALRRAVELAPGDVDFIAGLIRSLLQNFGPDEAEDIEEAYRLAGLALALGVSTASQVNALIQVFERVCAFDDLDRLGDFKSRGRKVVEAGIPSLLSQFARVRSREDRLELVEQHRIWGARVEAQAARSPVRRTTRPRNGKIRLGFMSSDLRNHPVSRFTRPIFDHVDRDRFELYAYSFSRAQAGPDHTRIAGQVDAFRWRPRISSREAAQMIADDDLDILIELGGPTRMNKPEAMAYRPAPIQLSWLGYPHSTGLSTIDYFVCDRRNQPTVPGLLIERPLLLPDSWVTLADLFPNDHPIDPALPEVRNGFLTFGTANNPYKYNRETLRAWARVVAATPNARFTFIRPEAGAPTFRANVLAEFAAEGVGAERVLFLAVRGDHMRAYNRIDIALDTFPLTGGTTTADALWMGVPTVSLVGEAFYERMSYSLLANVGLEDLCAFDLAGYTAAALGLAADRERRRRLRHGLRADILASPLGRREAFARDFYDLIAATVSNGGPAQ